MATHSLNWVVLSLSDSPCNSCLRNENPFPWIGSLRLMIGSSNYRSIPLDPDWKSVPMDWQFVLWFWYSNTSGTSTYCNSIGLYTGTHNRIEVYIGTFCRIVHRYIRIEVYIGKFILIKRYDDTFNRIGLYIGTSNRIGLCIDISTRIGLYISIYNRIGLHLGISAVLDCTLVKLLLNFMMTHLTVMDCTCIEGSFEWDT